jgi:hypothetical protein
VVAMHWQLRFVYNSVSNYCVLQAVLDFYAYLWRYLYELGNSVGNVPQISRGNASCTLAKWENSCVVSAVTLGQWQFATGTRIQAVRCWCSFLSYSK